jgi:hypothetical protein
MEVSYRYLYCLQSHSNIYIEFNLSLGLHNALTTLTVIIGDRISIFWFLRNLLFSAYLPALEHMVVIFEINADSPEYTIGMPLDMTELPILSEQIARSVSSLTFRFDVYGKGSLTIINWSMFEASLGIPKPEDIITHKLGPMTRRFPKLL